MTVKSHYDAIVVGLGGVGSFALRALSKEAYGSNRRYLGIELGSLAHSAIRDEPNVDSSTIAPQENALAGFSSRGLTRIYRRAYFEHANYVPWIDHSLNVFREMEASSGLSLMKECGVLLIEPCPTSHGNQSAQLPPLVTASMNSAHLHNVPVELLNADQLKQKFPQFSYSDDNNMVGLLEPGGGLLRPERIMNVALEDAVSSANVEIVDRTAVSIINCINEKNIVELQLSQRNNNDKNKETKKVTTDKLLVCMGAWTSALIPTWNRFLHPVRQVQGWINTKNEGKSDPFPNMFSSERMPAFLYISPDWPDALYGVPCDGNVDDTGDSSTCQRSWLKVGIHKQDISMSNHLSIDDQHRSVASSDEILELQRIIPLCINEAAWGGSEKTSDGKQPQLIKTKPCMYTMTPDKHFVIGEVSKNIFGVAGLSGHGFKMTPALGQIMADFACGWDVSTKWKTDFCSPNRFE
jgi:sarcosine oxidase